mmetsp:Transcript_91387/g.258345  ORF Transcript_91387/g.258345 Transcript_91387/m.258345 type:complete len:297 (+) Transcript_91387:265-1155(+)
MERLHHLQVLLLQRHLPLVAGSQELQNLGGQELVTEVLDLLEVRLHDSLDLRLHLGPVHGQAPPHCQCNLEADGLHLWDAHKAKPAEHRIGVLRLQLDLRERLERGRRVLLQLLADGLEAGGNGVPHEVPVGVAEEPAANLHQVLRGHFVEVRVEEQLGHRAPVRGLVGAVPRVSNLSDFGLRRRVEFLRQFPAAQHDVLVHDVPGCGALPTRGPSPAHRAADGGQQGDGTEQSQGLQQLAAPAQRHALLPGRRRRAVGALGDSARESGALLRAGDRVLEEYEQLVRAALLSQAGA